MAAMNFRFFKVFQHVHISVAFQWVKSFALKKSEKYFCIQNLGEKLASTLQGEKEDVDLAVTAARKAFESWGKLPGHARARYLYSIARHVQKHMRLVAVIESMDNGKPIRESRDCDIPIVIRHLYHHAGWAELAETEMKGSVRLINFLSSACQGRNYLCIYT